MENPERARRAIVLEIEQVERAIEARRAEGGNLRELKELERRWLSLQAELVKTRAHPRLPFLAEAWLTLPDGTQVPAQTKDISMGGVALRTIPGCVTKGDEVRIEMTLHDEDGEENAVRLEGTVAWTTGDCAGVAFSMTASQRVLPLLHAAMARAIESLSPGSPTD